MKIKFGLFSSDDHVQVDRDAFTKRMSKSKFGDRIPHVAETSKREHKAWDIDGPVERWFVNGRVVDTRGVTNSPAVMNDPFRTNSPQRWEEVPRSVYLPLERLKVLDEDRIDGEVLFPNPPVQAGTFFQGDAELELACVQAYNDAVAEWRAASDRYVPLALIPYLSGIKLTVAEVERVAKIGFRGIQMVAEPSAALRSGALLKLSQSNPALTGLNHFCDPYWEPLWAACQANDLPIHWHAGGGIPVMLPDWVGYSHGQRVAAVSGPSISAQVQFFPYMVFSGILERYPTLKWVCTESGVGWISYVIEACDYEWQQRRLWKEGILTRPSELLRDRLYASFWFETRGLELRHRLGVNQLMWESDFPHNTSTYPNSWQMVERTMAGIPDDERKQMLYENAVRLYRL